MGKRSYLGSKIIRIASNSKLSVNRNSRPIWQFYNPGKRLFKMYLCLSKIKLAASKGIKIKNRNALKRNYST